MIDTLISIITFAEKLFLAIFIIYLLRKIFAGRGSKNEHSILLTMEDINRYYEEDRAADDEYLASHK